MALSYEQHAALQWGQPESVRQISEDGRAFVKVQEAEMWPRAGLADVWNETVWDGYKSHADGDDRTGSLVFWVLEAHREAFESKALLASLQARFASGDARQQPSHEQEG